MKNYKAGAISAIITEAVIVILTIVSELYGKFKGILTAMTGHHWISKGLISLILFFVLYFAFRKLKTKENDIWKYTKSVFWITLLSSLIIFLFFVVEFF